MVPCFRARSVGGGGQSVVRVGHLSRTFFASLSESFLLLIDIDAVYNSATG